MSLQVSQNAKLMVLLTWIWRLGVIYDLTAESRFNLQLQYIIRQNLFKHLCWKITPVRFMIDDNIKNNFKFHGGNDD